jgi:hypothetical protein
MKEISIPLIFQRKNDSNKGLYPIASIKLSMLAQVLRLGSRLPAAQKLS